MLKAWINTGEARPPRVSTVVGMVAPIAVLMVPVLGDAAATRGAAMVNMTRNEALTHIAEVASSACLILLDPPRVGRAEMAMVARTA